MKTERLFPAAVLTLAILISVQAAGDVFAQQDDVQPWQEPYTGPEATGPNVVALWQFNPQAADSDGSGNGHRLTLRGRTRFVDEGRFGGCLESFAIGEDNGGPEGAMAKNDPRLTPAGPFTIEAWFKAKPEMDACATVFLLDKKYFHYAKDLPHANTDYSIFMRRTGPNRRRITAYLGFGSDSAAYTSDEVSIEPDRWYHFAFAYDGAGTGRLFLDGKSIGRASHEGRGPVAPGRYGLVIGCRYGSTYSGFPGYIDQVRISQGVVPFFSGTLEVGAPGARTAFLRMERDARVRLAVFNDTGKRLNDAVARFSLAGREGEIPLPALEPSESRTVDVEVDTTLRPDSYPLDVTVTASAEERSYQARLQTPVVIVPRPTPGRMPVVMWGHGDLDTLDEIGFTHHIVGTSDYGKIWDAGQPTEAVSSARMAELADVFNEHLVRRIGAVVNPAPGRWVSRNQELAEQYQRINRDGKPYERENACTRFPELQEFGYNVGASIATTFGRFPAVQAALIHSEVRDSSNLCFHDHDRAAFREFAGREIPDEAISKAGVRYSDIDGFPANRVIPDDDPLLAFYRWFWKDGDGWNPLHTQVHKGLKSTGREDLWTFFDPAVRVPSIWGSGGQVDVISQWTYTYPDPIKIGQAADELFAMAAGSPHGQQVMKMTQIIWYRTRTAPKLPENESDRAPWEIEIPEAPFITIAPDHLREAFWSKISRPVRGIMYHGWGSLVGAPHTGYRYTNPQTREVLTELIHQVVRPLGPTLLEVPDRPSDVALLESFTSQMFARRGTRGWGNSWEADMHLVLQWAQIQPQIVYEETILRDGLDQFRVLVLPHCDVLTESIAREVQEFQKRGGIVIADDTLCPALSADILVSSCERTGEGDRDKAALQTKAAELRKELDPRYGRGADSSNADVVVRLRQYGRTDYLFAVNDKRTFGEYVGHHGRVMERGLPTNASLFIKRQGGYVYDLVAGEPEPIRQTASGIVLDADFDPGAGRVFMVTDQEIADVRIVTPDEAQLGSPLDLDVSVVDLAGQPVRAVIPVWVEILDPDGRPAELSGFYAAKDGRLTISAEPAPNDKPGRWTIRAVELASHRSGQATVAVVPAR